LTNFEMHVKSRILNAGIAGATLEDRGELPDFPEHFAPIRPLPQQIARMSPASCALPKITGTSGIRGHPGIEAVPGIAISARPFKFPGAPPRSHKK